MNTDKVRELIQELLSSVKQMVVCSCKDNQPWAATVFFAFDKDLNLYFFSRENRRHSKEIAENPKVAGAIAREHKEGLGEQSRGVQFEGECKLIEPNNLNEGYDLYKMRFPQITNVHPLKNASKELYRIKVKKFVLFDTLNFPDISRQELDMK